MLRIKAACAGLFSLALLSPFSVPASAHAAVAPSYEFDSSSVLNRAHQHEHTPAANHSQLTIGGNYILSKANVIARMAHPTLKLNDYNAYINGSQIVLELRYKPSGILGLEYETRIAYEFGYRGMNGARVLHDTALVGAFETLALVKDIAAELLRDAREEKEQQDQDVGSAARALEYALSQDVSGVQIHLLIIRLMWAVDKMVPRYLDAG